MACTVEELQKRLAELVKEDPSVAQLPVYSNSPMDAEYAFSLGHRQGVYVGEVHEVEDGSTYIEQESAQQAADPVEDYNPSITCVRALVIDTH